MGTTLTMSVIVVVGTLLPLLVDPEGKLFTRQGAWICGGLGVCGAAFWAAAVALKRKDIDEEEAEKIEMKTVNPSSIIDEETATFNQTPPPPPSKTYSTFYKVLVCVVSGILCTMLQFSFVFSSSLRTLASETYSLPPSRSASITFFFAITICPIPNILIPAYTLNKSKKLHLLYTSPSAKISALKCLTIMSIPWVIQSHLYGLSANSLLGEYGDAIGWPVLIVTTNVTGLILGWKVLGEWEKAKEETVRWVIRSIGLSVVGLGIVSAGGFV
ncbi:hypothetical protein TrVE_jg9665 [Triparma verrucosa]|uniref:Uncharacterized protein n=1 Tax=Triparma verrucosa TaxID=1606542 RepID=A0A9W7BRR0_9STRA|nr:hypothetical protein TrVE_jg9665 [Triparma verrucosa]